MQMIRCYNCMREFDVDIDDICPHCGYYRKTQEEDDKYAKALPAGTILGGKYYIGRVLGIGGFAITYIAYNYLLQCKVAIKEYFPSDWANRSEDGITVDCGYAENAEQFRMGLAQFAEESHKLAKVGSHNGIVNIFETFYDNETAYIAMEYVDGVPLERILADEGPMNYLSLIKIIVPICSSLDKIHTNDRIIHRDIAPDNIMLQPNGKAKLIDFGASLNSEQINENLILKHGYAPIEQYDVNDSCTARTDVYAMCAVLYHMLSGKRPPKSEARKKAIESGKADPLLPLSGFGIEIPEGLELLIMKGLSVFPEDRIASAQELADGLSVFLPGYTPPEIEIPKNTSNGKWKIFIPVAAAIAVIASILIFFITRAPESINESTVCGYYPDVTEQSVKQAEKSLEDSDKYFTEDAPHAKELQFKIVKNKEQTIKTADEELDGRIARQEQTGGSEITPGDISDDNTIRIDVILYEYDKNEGLTKDALITVPSVVGKTKKSAANILKEAGFTNISYKEQYSFDTEKNMVISISPKAGSKLLATKKIVVTVSNGPEPTTEAPTYAKPTNPTPTKPSPYIKPSPVPTKPAPKPSNPEEFSEIGGDSVLFE